MASAGRRAVLLVSRSVVRRPRGRAVAPAAVALGVLVALPLLASCAGPTRAAGLPLHRSVAVSVVALDGGEDHVCTAGADGLVRCFGQNRFGQSGDGDPSSQRREVRPALDVRDATAVAAGDGFSCAASRTDGVRCWGQNTLGQAGDGTEGTVVLVPSRVRGLRGATAIGAGANHACAVAEGEVWCWGDGDLGQLGTGAFETATTPRRAQGLGPVQQLAVGTDHTCAVADGAVRCWGANHSGQLGDGTTDDRATPTPVRGLGRVDAVGAGSAATCAVVAGSVWCWGSNAFGQLGDGSTVDRRRPVRVRGVRDAQEVAVGDRHACARTADALWCWGGSPDDGAGTPRRRPVPGISGLAVTDGRTCAAVDERQLRCWGLPTETWGAA